MATALSTRSTLESASALSSCRKSLASLAILVAGIIAAFSDAALSMADLWLHSSVYHHGALVAPISLWLILRRENLGALSPTSDWLGVGLVGLSSLFWLISAASGVALVGHAALVGALIGAAVTAFGWSFACRHIFALGFLFLMVPFGEELTPALQHGTAVAVTAMLHGAGVDVVRDGFMLTSGPGRFEIAPSCAGLRFLLASAVLSALVGELAFSTWRKRAAFVAAALFIAILANWLRAFLIVSVAIATDMAIGVGPEHVALGWALYASMIVGLIFLARRLADRPEEPATIVRQQNAGDNYRLAPCAAALIVLFSVAAYDARVVSAPKVEMPSSRLEPFHAPDFAVIAPRADWTAFAPNADHHATNAYRLEDATIVVSIAAFDYDRRGAEIAGAHVAAGDGRDWRRIAVGQTAPTIETWENNAGRRINVAVRYWLGDRIYASSLALKRDLALQKLRGKKSPGGALFIAAPHDANTDPAAALDAFLNAMEPVAEWRARLRAPT